jgi:hypothetical protein
VEDAPVIEQGSEGVRMMTVHTRKGSNLTVVILADALQAAILQAGMSSRRENSGLNRCVGAHLSSSSRRPMRNCAATGKRRCGLLTWRQPGRETCWWRRFAVMGRSAAGWRCSTRGYILQSRRNGNPILFPAPLRSAYSLRS